MEENRPASCPIRLRWLRRFMAAGFLFFLVKGLVWLAVGGIALAAAIW